MAKEAPQAVVLKIVHGEEIRRLSTSPRPTFEQLVNFARESLPGPKDAAHAKLFWRDEDNDQITLKSQFDLDECFNFIAAGKLSTFKIYVEASPPSYDSTTVPPPQEELDRKHPAASSDADTGDEDDAEEEEDTEEEAEDRKEREEEEADDRVLEDELKELEDELKGVTLEEDRKLELSPKLAKKLGKMNDKFAKKQDKFAKKLSKVLHQPGFPERSYALQSQILVDAGIPISSPFLQLHIAKAAVKREKKLRKLNRKNNKRLQKEARKKLKTNTGSEIPKPDSVVRLTEETLNLEERRAIEAERELRRSKFRHSPKWAERMSPKSRAQLQTLEEYGLPRSFWIAKILEFDNEPLDPGKPADAVVLNQLRELTPLFPAIPPAFLVQLLRKVNAKTPRTFEGVSF